jgi:hypothetical protein
VTIRTLRRIREDRFEVTGPDIEPATFKTRVEARDWCLTRYPGSPIREVGGRKRGTPRAVRRVYRSDLDGTWQGDDHAHHAPRQR